MVKNLFRCAFVLVVLSTAACTEPGEKTGLASATGGVIGAGLGAIVGSQTGSAGGGLVVGAVAGSAAGGLVGNALEAQDEAIRSQDEAIERQEQFVRAQRSEIDELRRVGQDQVVRRPGQRQALRPTSAREEFPKTASRPNVPLAPAAAERARLRERELSPMTVREVEKPRAPAPTLREVVREPVATAPLARVARDELPATGECRDAEVEVQNARSAQLDADRLFHYRRALRLCPDAPVLHNGLGEVYLRLNRTADAEFEFREALRLDPTNGAARGNLEQLTSKEESSRG